MLVMGGEGLRCDQGAEIAGFAGRESAGQDDTCSFTSNSMVPSW